MYCGGKIPQRKGTSLPPSGKAPEIGARGAQKSPAAAKHPTGADDDAAEEEEGNFAAFLQSGEQVLIGSLNVSVKKFFFHAYLTNQRIFLIDTQEKKLKVTAKDIPLSTISGCIVETSESSDPVLVVSTRTEDDEVKTMKIVFTGNGLDRTEEIDEWVELLNEQVQPKKPKKPAPKRPVPEPEEEPEISEEEERGDEAEEEEAPVRRPQKPVSARQEIRPVKKPVKDHERQPPVKRLHPVYEPPAEEEMEDLPPKPKPAPRYAETGEKGLSAIPAREIPPRVSAVKPVKKVEVQSAMKGALKGAVPPVRPPAEKPAGTVAVRRSVQVRPEPVVAEEAEEEQAPPREEPVHEEEETAGPVFCQNCGKKLPASANFCPGCGAKIAAHREKPAPKAPAKSAKRHEQPEEAEEREPRAEPQAEKPEEPRPVKPPAKKTPKGSEMTILHKFLRR